jgi:hypothetical protein
MQRTKQTVFVLIMISGAVALTHQSDAASCVNGVYRAGCVGSNGAAVVHKTVPAYRAKPVVRCVNGVYRAGCVGPYGAATVRKY